MCLIERQQERGPALSGSKLGLAENKANKTNPIKFKEERKEERNQSLMVGTKA